MGACCSSPVSIETELAIGLSVADFQARLRDENHALTKVAISTEKLRLYATSLDKSVDRMLATTDRTLRKKVNLSSRSRTSAVGVMEMHHLTDQRKAIEAAADMCDRALELIGDEIAPKLDECTAEAAAKLATASAKMTADEHRGFHEHTDDRKKLRVVVGQNQALEKEKKSLARALKKANHAKASSSGGGGGGAADGDAALQGSVAMVEHLRTVFQGWRPAAAGDDGSAAATLPSVEVWLCVQSVEELRLSAADCEALEGIVAPDPPDDDDGPDGEIAWYVGGRAAAPPLRLLPGAVVLRPPRPPPPPPTCCCCFCKLSHTSPLPGSRSCRVSCRA